MDAIRGKVCLVTGATSGIGRVAAVELARLGATVLISGRDRARGEAVLADIRRQGGTAEFLPCDLSEQGSVRMLAEQVKARAGKLHVLMNNAGTVFSERKLTADGVERTFAVNHLAPFLLTNLLREPLAAAAAADRYARVVTVASAAHSNGRIHFDDLNGERRYRSVLAYCNSKLANVLFTTELARRWKDLGITANTLHPGVVRTNIWDNTKGILKFLVTLLQPFMITVEQGAQTMVYLAASPEVAGVTGAYFIKCREVPASPAGRDPALAARLWETSEKLTGLTA